MRFVSHHCELPGRTLTLRVLKGGLEFLTKATTLSAPFYKIRPPGLPATLPSVQMMSVDILPASIPLDASRSFSDALLPHLTAAIAWQDEFAELGTAVTPYPDVLERATIAKDGMLTAKHAWLLPSVEAYHSAQAAEQTSVLPPSEASAVPAESAPADVEWRAAGRHTPKKKILLLGSGMVAQPAVDMLAGRGDIELVIGAHVISVNMTDRQASYNITQAATRWSRCRLWWRRICMSNTGSLTLLIPRPLYR